jgi:hypothetical protein
MSDGAEIYQFGESGRFRLDPPRREFYRDGRPVPLTDQSFDLLLYLVANSQIALRKQDLVRAIWKGERPPVDGIDNSLKVIFSEVYRALDDSGTPKKTIRRKNNFTTFMLVARQIPRPSADSDGSPQSGRVEAYSAIPGDVDRGSKTRAWPAGLLTSRSAKVVIGLAAVGILGLWLWDRMHFRADLTVSVRDAPASFDPYDDQFAIQNKSAEAIPDLELGCYGLHFHVETPPMANPQTGIALVPTMELDRSEVDEDDVTPYRFRDALEPNGTVYLPCSGIIQVPYRFPPETPGKIVPRVIQRAEAQPAPEPKFKVTYGDVVVFVQYRLPFLPLHRREYFRFLTRPGSDGKYHWNPVAQPATKVVHEVHGHAALYTRKVIFGSEALTDVTGSGKP